MHFCAAVSRGQQKSPHNQTSARTERTTRQDSGIRACAKTTSKVHVVGLVRRSVDTTSNGEENKSMFQRCEVWSRRENATPQQARRQSSTRERQGDEVKTTLRVKQGYTRQANTKQPHIKALTLGRRENQRVESPSVKHRALHTDETSHPHALVYSHHMVPTLPAEQTYMNSATGRSEHRTLRKVNETTSH